jgi:RHS repeat-associated protein
MHGRLSSLQAPDGTGLAYEYDGFLPMTETWSGPISGTVARRWDDNFWLRALDIGGTEIQFDYDADGLLTRAGDLTIERATETGLIEALTLGQTAETWTYNGFGELGIQAATIFDDEIYAVEYERDPLGRITQRRERLDGETRLTTYEYDEASRLVSVKEGGLRHIAYTYDANGNRLSRQTSGGVQEVGTYDNQDRLLIYGGRSYEYTRNGELKAWTENGTRTDFEYDEFGNLRRALLPGGVEIEYLVDGQNRRIGKRIDGELVQGFLYQDGLNPIAELDGDGNIRSRFIYGSRLNVPDYMVRDGRTYRIVSDHLGSPRLIVDADTGETFQWLDYDDFGRVLKDTNPGFQPFGFAGGIYDQHIGFVRFGARDYDPYTGRWTAKDPIRFDGDGPNLYGYVLNNPVNWIDPDGLFGIVAFGACEVILSGGGTALAVRAAGNTPLDPEDDLGVLRRIDERIEECNDPGELAKLLDMRRRLNPNTLERAGSHASNNSSNQSLVAVTTFLGTTAICVAVGVASPI